MQFGAVESLIGKIVTYIINPLISVLFALAFLLFIWGVARFLLQGDDETAREQGKKHMIWGLVGMFIMVAVAGIVGVIAGTLGVPIFPLQTT